MKDESPVAEDKKKQELILRFLLTTWYPLRTGQPVSVAQVKPKSNLTKTCICGLSPKLFVFVSVSAQYALCNYTRGRMGTTTIRLGGLQRPR